MADQGSNYKHSDSDRKLDRSADAQKPDAAGPGHDPEEIKKHDDKGKDRLFEGREQHDDAEQASEKNRLAKDNDRHAHPDEDDADSVSGAAL